MGQVLNSKHNGPVEFDQTWAMGQSHVGLLTGGGYAHVPTGRPLARKEDGLDAIPPGPAQEAFLEWWENKDKKPVEEIKKKIIVNPDGSYSFDDGTDILNAQDLIGYFGSGEALEQALRWFANELVRRDAVAKAATTKAGHFATKARTTAAKQTGKPATSPPQETGPPEVAVKE